MRVPLADLAAQYRNMKDEIDAAIAHVLEDGRFILGPVVEDLEAKIAAYCDATYGVAVNSGTDALLLSLVALGIGPGDEVITTPFTFVATVEAIVQAGATPVFADIDPATYILCPEKVRAKITSATRAIMPVDLFGHMADRRAYAELVDGRPISIVWDSAQAIGCRAEGKSIGAYADAATLSFFPTKNLGAFGDGGMVVTCREDVRDRLLKLRFHGSGGGYHYSTIGYCSRLDALQAAILSVKLLRLEAWTESRRSHAAVYRSLLAGTACTLPVEAEGYRHCYHQFTIRHERRDELKQFLATRGIDSGIYYPQALHLQDAYSWLQCAPGDFPESELACEQVLSLPVHPDLTTGQIEFVANAIREFESAGA